MATLASRDDLLSLCLEMTTEAHEGQVDKAGKPYIGHPVRVSQGCSTEVRKAAALLHYVIEDAPLTADDLRARGVLSEAVRRDLERTEKYCRAHAILEAACRQEGAQSTSTLLELCAN